MDPNTAMMVVGGAAGYKLLELIIHYFFKKFTREDVVIRRDCDARHREDIETIERLTEEMSSVKRILLILASKQGIPPEQLSELVR